MASDTGNLRRHIQSIHEGKKYPCGSCSYQATQKGSLKVHIQSIHEGRKYHCSLCNYQASQRGSLNVHLVRIHNASTLTGVKVSFNQKSTEESDKMGNSDTPEDDPDDLKDPDDPDKILTIEEEVTAEDETETGERPDEAGMNSFLNKPPGKIAANAN